MKLQLVLLEFALIPVVTASVGDTLPEFRSCLSDCQTECSSSSPSSKYDQDSISPVAAKLFQWNCELDCGYKCQQLISRERRSNGLPMVQFYGKWPFKRIFGITEIFSTIFSLGNLVVNYRNYGKIKRARKYASFRDPEKATMLSQYLLLLAISIAGWIFSTVFHIRDFPETETLDYLGAGAIIVANFNAIVVRKFFLFRQEKKLKRVLFQTCLCVALMLHYARLYRNWDYGYNMNFNIVFGMLSLLLWILHAFDVRRQYLRRPHFYNNSIQLLPYETKILAKLNYLGLSKTKNIPLIPVSLNIFLICAMGFEVLDFEPWRSLVDGHSLWHLSTIFPPIVWFDWNIWDLEMSGLQTKGWKK